ncbi:hypothetical protein FLK61_29810 [Paenalkalicoccus suaedae]|uniref:Uncharacterized protein n=1 Tax=Paenalkalicoccus suaedae TaxID=2592382 RepID=A0A859FDL0_9BACI|nr:hypothetical protein [Paenalkalicoccus suaedae]QKS70921.1 hypothetical protein FLK61_29810 [Paenalkalicoccus suaedae]
MKGNKIVLFLPMIVMIGLFVFGYMYLSDLDAFTNERIEESIQFELEKENNIIDVSWQWGGFPEDGVTGNDYVELISENGDLWQYVDSVELTLFQADEVIYTSSEWSETQEGIAIAFPTYVSNEQIAGPFGTINVTLTEDVPVSARYYHTWAEEDGIFSAESSLGFQLQETIPGQFFVVEAE